MWQQIYRKSSQIKHLHQFVRHLNLMEYQSKNLLRENGVAIQNFCLSDKEDKSELKNFNVEEYFIKAQILAGGRGKGHFSNGFKGGVHITKNKNDIDVIVSQMVGYNLITKQTPKDGILVKKVMIAESVNILRETYLCIAMDRNSNGPVIVASPADLIPILQYFEYNTESIDVIQNQWKNITLVQWQNTSSTLSFWAEVNIYRDANSENPFQELSDFALSLLVLPHSNAEVERLFSMMNMVKTKLRNRMQLPMLCSILAIRSGLNRKNKCCYNFDFPRKVLNNLNNLKTHPFNETEMDNLEDIFV